MRRLAAVLACLLANPVLAQARVQSTVRVRVVDSADVAVANVDVAVMQGLSSVVARGTTSPLGEATLAVTVGGEYELVARQIGFQRASRFFTSTPEPMALTIHLARSVARLEAVNVTEFSRKAAYRLGADEIAASTRPLVDAFDVIGKLRPRIFSPSPRSKFNPCAMQNIWVNGQRIVYASDNDRMLMELRHKWAVQGATFNPKAYRTPSPPNGVASVPLNVLNVLASIHAEHIEEINYSDCLDNSVEGVHTSNSVFVTLKPGVAFEPGIGSFVAPVPVALPGNRTRIVGVFDQDTGQPLPGVQVVDSASGVFVTTSETGTALLAFLADGSHVMRLIRAGYTPLRVMVGISARDSLPLTLTLAPHP